MSPAMLVQGFFGLDLDPAHLANIPGTVRMNGTTSSYDLAAWVGDDSTATTLDFLLTQALELPFGLKLVRH
jgi:hypothetical protein